VICLHKLNGEPVTVNAELIQTIESIPETVITLGDRRKVMVAEDVDEVAAAALEYRRRVVGVPGSEPAPLQ